jgi:RimJ/RimL family protein N-acetyltransferase
LKIEPAIRPYRDSDARSLQQAALESTAEVFPWLEWCHPGYSLQEAEEWVRTRRELFAEASEYEFAIVGWDDRFLGGCGLNRIRRATRTANLGYWVRTSAAGCGVATGAARQLVRFAFEKTDLVKLEIVCAVGNLGSQRVAEKVGAVRQSILASRMTLHGRPHDAVLYSIQRHRGAAG